MGMKVLRSMAIVVLLVAAGPVRAEDTLADSVKKACNKELTSFCKGVPQGQGRIVACLYAFEDKLSDKCVTAVYNAAVQLEEAVNALKYAATQCSADLDKFCANVEVGEGRALACLNKHDKDVSQTCKDALKKTGLRK